MRYGGFFDCLFYTKNYSITVFTTDTRTGSVAMEKRVDMATMRLASVESRLNLVANRAQEAATGAPNITASGGV